MIALETHLGPILVRFWVPKSFQNRSQEGPERCWKSWSILNAFRIFQESIFWPTWAQHDPILPPNTAPSWSQNWTKIGSKTASGAKSAPEPILNDFSSILGRCWIDFGPMLGPIWLNFWVDIWPGVVSMLRWVLIHFRNDFLVDFWSFVCSPLGRACNCFWANTQLRSQIALHMDMCSPTLVSL